MSADDLIHRNRNAAFSMMVGDLNGKPPITDMFPIADNLYIIKTKSIYLVKTADGIDPNRSNINIPNLQKKVLNYGSENEIVGRALLTARILFDKNHLGPDFNYSETLSNTF